MGYFDDFRAKLGVAAPAAEGAALGLLGAIAPSSQFERALGQLPDRPVPGAAPSGPPAQTPVLERPVATPAVVRDESGMAYNRELPPIGPQPPPAAVTAAPQPPAAQARPAQGGGGGGMGALAKKVERDDERLLKTYETEERDTQKLADAQMAQVEGVAALRAAEAARQQEAVERQARVDADTAQRMERFQAESLKFADDLRAERIDPNRLYGNADTGTQLGFMIGGALGGLTASSSGGRNTFVDGVNKQIERDIAAQEANYQHGKDYLKARDNVYSQMRDAAGDARLAALQYRQGRMEAAKLQMQSEADRLGIPEIQARATLQVGAIDREQAKLQKELDARRLQVAQQQAAAAESARAAREKMLWERQKEIIAIGQKNREIDIAEGKANKEAKGDLEQRVEGYGKAVGKQELVDAANALQGLKAALPADEKKGIPGVGPMADFREKLTTANPVTSAALHLTSLGGLNQLGRLDADERVNRQNWNQLFDKYRVAVTGAGAGEGELEKLKASFEGANTPAEQRNAIAKAEALLARTQSNARGTYGADAEAEFARRMRGGAK